MADQSLTPVLLVGEVTQVVVRGLEEVMCEVLAEECVSPFLPLRRSGPLSTLVPLSNSWGEGFPEGTGYRRRNE